MWDRYPEQIRTTPARCVEGQALVITPQNSTLHTLNETGTFIWEKSDGALTLAEIVDLLRAEFRTEQGELLSVKALRIEAEAFVASAEQKGILRVLDAPA